MLTGKQPFAAGSETVSDAVAAILRGEPEWATLPGSTPAGIQRLLRRCLAKDPRKRLHHIADARIELDETGLADEQSVAHPAARYVRVPAVLAAAATLAAFGVAATYLLRPAPSSAPPEMRVQIVGPSTSTPDDFALSPDGLHIVFVASADGPRRLWLRDLDTTDAKPIAGTDGADVRLPFWSPDSHTIAFFASSKLYRVDVRGGTPQAIANVADGRGGTWNTDGTILFAPIALGPIWRMSVAGGDPTVVTSLDSPRQAGHRFPQFLPDGRHFVFYSAGTPEGSGIYLASLDGGGAAKRLTDADGAGAFLRPASLVFSQQGALVARHLDIANGALTGEPAHIADGVGAFSVSANGLVAYVGGARRKARAGVVRPHGQVVREHRSRRQQSGFP